ncbi:MAG TPA: NADH-quinone oxidoreductase subunit NuoF [Rectinemataceae bacterium]|nr:NADH-quinone oxidoreductase subunit NuoF [Rectinemataceae bacterium]
MGQMKLLLEHAEKAEAATLAGWKSLGGYQKTEAILKGKSPEAILDQIKDSGLRGRGGAGFPAGLKWSFLAKNTGKPSYLVCNADESEPGTFKDRYIMERMPHQLIEGMIVSSYAIGANRSYIYIRGEYMYILRILEKAIAEAYAAGYLGKNILGTGYDLELSVHPGAGAYICGEETALLESLEGKRGNPRIKPPFPAVQGLYASPTVVNNVETIATVPYIVAMSGAAYAALGVKPSTGTKLISASGHIKRPGVYEIELGKVSCEEFLYSDEFCGGPSNGRPFKAVIPGGSSVPVLPIDLFMKTASGASRMMSYESLADGGFATGTQLGSGGLFAMDDSACMVRNLWNLSRFYHHESCGQCSPCREGTGWLEKILHRLEAGEGKMSDIDLLVDIAKHIEGNTICPLGDAAAWPVASHVRHFRHEFEYHVRFPEKVRDPKHNVAAPIARPS